MCGTNLQSLAWEPHTLPIDLFQITKTKKIHYNLYKT